MPSGVSPRGKKICGRKVCRVKSKFRRFGVLFDEPVAALKNLPEHLLREKVFEAAHRMYVDPAEEELARILLVSAGVGPDERQVATALGLPVARVAKWGPRFRELGIWGEGLVACDDWDEGKIGFLGFMWDIAAVLGKAVRDLHLATGRIVYKQIDPADPWWRNNLLCETSLYAGPV
jgi:hypothetical protein